MKKILIVEDETEVAAFLKGHLEENGFEIDVAADGRSAIEKIGSFLPLIVILDIILPEIDGLEVLKWIKRNRPDTAVILATAKKELADLKKGYALEADYYLTKPYSLEEVIRAINIMISLKSE